MVYVSSCLKKLSVFYYLWSPNKKSFYVGSLSAGDILGYLWFILDYVLQILGKYPICLYEFLCSIFLLARTVVTLLNLAWLLGCWWQLFFIKDSLFVFQKE